MVLGFNVKQNSSVLHNSVLYHTFLINSEINIWYMKVTFTAFIYTMHH
jgi:hypothetical protein